MFQFGKKNYFYSELLDFLPVFIRSLGLKGESL